MYQTLINSQVFDLVDSGISCSKSTQWHLPFPLYDFAGYGFLNGTTALVCGGLNRITGNSSNVCHLLGHPTEEVVLMNRSVKGSASVVVNDSILWITGGLEVVDNPTDQNSDWNAGGSRNFLRKTVQIAT